MEKIIYFKDFKSTLIVENSEVAPAKPKIKPGEKTKPRQDPFNPKPGTNPNPKNMNDLYKDIVIRYKFLDIDKKRK